MTDLHEPSETDPIHCVTCWSVSLEGQARREPWPCEVTRLRASVSHLTEMLTGYGDDDYAAAEGGTQ